MCPIVFTPFYFSIISIIGNAIQNKKNEEIDERSKSKIEKKEEREIRLHYDSNLLNENVKNGFNNSKLP